MARGIWTGDKWEYLPVPKQVEFIESTGKYTLFAGAAGVSKSHASRWGLYTWCLRIPNLRCLLLREVSDELMRSHIRGLMDVEAKRLGASFAYNPVPLARWPNGSFIEGGHMEDAAAVRRYLSAEYDIICAEEATQYLPEPLMELMTRARTTNEQMRKHGGARVWLPTNPGGPSTSILRTLFLEKFIDPDEWPSLAKTYRPDEWIYIPGRLEDNPYLDPDYERSLSVIKQQWRFKQLREGDWWASPGLFFDQFQQSHHARSITLHDPRRLQWFRSLDWGYHDPGVVLWWVVLGERRLHIVSELRFQYRTVEELNQMVRERDRELGLPEPYRDVHTWASPDMWQHRGQVGEYLQETARRCGWPLRQAKTERTNGWMRLQSLLRDNADGEPYLTVDPLCRYLVRSFQTAMSDDHDPNDIRQIDDHALESARYGAMSRPRFRELEQPTQHGEFDEDFRPTPKVWVGASTGWR